MCDLPRDFIRVKHSGVRVPAAGQPTTSRLIMQELPFIICFRAKLSVDTSTHLLLTEVEFAKHRVPSYIALACLKMVTFKEIWCGDAYLMFEVSDTLLLSFVENTTTNMQLSVI